MKLINIMEVVLIVYGTILYVFLYNNVSVVLQKAVEISSILETMEVTTQETSVTASTPTTTTGLLQISKDETSIST